MLNSKSNSAASAHILTDLRTAWRLHDFSYVHELTDVSKALLLATICFAIEHTLYDMDPHDTTNDPPAGPAPSEHSSTTPHATLRGRIRRFFAHHFHAPRPSLRRSRPSHDFIATNDTPTHATTAQPGRTDGILDAIERHRETTEQGFNRIADAISQAALGFAGHGGGPGGFPPGIAPDPLEFDNHQPSASSAQEEASIPNGDLLNFANPDLTGNPSCALGSPLGPVSPSQSHIRPSNGPRSPHVSRDYDPIISDETSHAARYDLRSRGECASHELAESGAGPSDAPLGNLSQAHEVVRDEQREENSGATSCEQQIHSAPQEEDNGPQASSSQEHHDISDSSSATSATSGEGDPAAVLNAHDRDTLDDILAHPEAHQQNVEFQLADFTPEEDPFPELAPSPDPVPSALYTPLSRTIPLPALDQPGSGVAPAQSGPVASSSGRVEAAQTAGPAASAPLFFPSLETSPVHSESSALLNYSPAAEAETRRYDEGSARRQLAAMMSDSPRRAADQGVEEGQQQQQSVASDAASASDGEAFHHSSPRQETPPDNDAEQSSDAADEDPTRAVLDVAQQNLRSTYIHYRDFVVADGVFIGRRLLISVGRKVELPDPSEPFDEGLNNLLYVCEARQHDLTQLYVEVHQSRVSGGQYDDQDTLNAILLAIRAYLPSFNTAVVSFKAFDDVQATQAVQQARRSIANDFSHLHHVRIEGITSAARLLTFPIQDLCVLEALFPTSEMDIKILLMHRSDRLAFLTAGPIDSRQPNYLSGFAHGSRASPIADHPHTFVVHLKSAFPCEQALKSVPGNAVVHFTLTETRGLDKLRAIMEVHPTWTMRLD
ncbi:uncharacterized protein SCHCODRAFT_02753714 [Schizophyllum commune H4-8]|nr:uncharacterized protein SCHCODRAFT_02685091 [Schizophyllum commune H4-8]XP_050197185.1 uncharacterized protein SCHCODRAFT_02753714 [Schizophyllum commune H4-8]KAI5885466.1 hypothetical protein SCHCODRAFT_02753714 [Schizophyllum commune H4-8]KAI5898975.1 hypothetical protein SCHCODRAFT_02685091 [Schizophyllum commune H4-8]